MAFRFQTQGGKNATPVNLVLACDPDVAAANSSESLEKYLKTGDSSGLTIPEGAGRVSIRALGAGEGPDLNKDVAADSELALGLVVNQRIWGDSGQAEIVVQIQGRIPSDDDDDTAAAEEKPEDEPEDEDELPVEGEAHPAVTSLAEVLAGEVGALAVDVKQRGRQVTVRVTVDARSVAPALVAAAVQYLEIYEVTVGGGRSNEDRLADAAALSASKRRAMSKWRAYTTSLSEARARAGLVAFDGQEGKAAWALINRLRPQDRAAVINEIATHINRITEADEEGKG